MKYEAVVTRVVKESPRISTVYFTVDTTSYSYTAGKYICVYFEETGARGGKAYSLSSAPFNSELSITVKDIGEFSHLICNLKPGDTLQISAPFGHFNVNSDAPIVAIAAGVGISPIWSIIQDELKQDITRRINLFLTAAREEELVFYNAVNNLFANSVHAYAQYYVTREVSKRGSKRRFSVKTDLQAHSLVSAQFYICGPELFVQDIWRQLMEAGVDTRRVVTEVFFESYL